MRHRLALSLVAGLCFLVSAHPAAAQSVPVQVGLSLAPGWNNVAYVGPDQPLPAALAPVSGRYEAVWTWDAQAQRWLGMNALLPELADITSMRHNQAYWIRMSLPGELVVAIPPVRTAGVLTPGWNNFVYAGAEQPVGDALMPASGRYQSVWRWDAGRQHWQGFMPDALMASDFTALRPNHSYFVQIADGAPVTLPAFSGTAQSLITSAPPPAVSVPVAGAATPAPSPSSPARGRTCHTFQSYQPRIDEVSRAFDRAGFGRLTPDQDFRIKELETEARGSGAPVPAVIPPTLLKAVGWVESGWRQSTAATARGAVGPTVASTSCAYGLMQLLTGMKIEGTPTAKQQRIGADYAANIAAGAQMLGIKWNLAPEHIPAVLPREPGALEPWYYAVWAYHCFGEVCESLGIHNHPDDPALKWPRPPYNSPDQLESSTRFSFRDYPYQELVYGLVAYPPKVNNAPAWPPLSVGLPPRGAVRFPEPAAFQTESRTVDPTAADGPLTGLEPGAR